MSAPEETVALLDRWQHGDGSAFHALVERHLPFVEQQVRQRLGAAMRGKAETQDYVQDVLVEILRYCPNALPENEHHFRNLLVRIAENHLRDRFDWAVAQRRSAAREEPLPSESAMIRRIGTTLRTPSRAAVTNENERWLRMALHLLDPDDRRIILLREWEKLHFEAIAERLGTTAEAARKRFHRALPRLLAKVLQLQRSVASRPGE